MPSISQADLMRGDHISHKAVSPGSCSCSLGRGLYLRDPAHHGAQDLQSPWDRNSIIAPIPIVPFLGLVTPFLLCSHEFGLLILHVGGARTTAFPVYTVGAMQQAAVGWARCRPWAGRCRLGQV